MLCHYKRRSARTQAEQLKQNHSINTFQASIVIQNVLLCVALSSSLYCSLTCHVLASHQWISRLL